MGADFSITSAAKEPMSMDMYLAVNEKPDPGTAAMMITAKNQIKASNARIKLTEEQIKTEKKALASAKSAQKGSNMSDISNVGSYGQIASGRAINRAADGASELAIGKKMEAQERGLNKGAENIAETRDLLNISDGAMQSITDNLQRIRELSLKAANGLTGDEEKASIQSEISGLMENIEQVARDTQYNEKNLLDGSYATLEVAENPDGRGMSIQLENATLEALGINGYDVTGDFDITKIDNALEKISSDRSSIGSQTNALEYAYRSNLNTAENVLASRSRLEDLDIEKAVTDQKKNEVITDYQTLLLKRKEEEDSMVTKLFQ